MDAGLTDEGTHSDHPIPEKYLATDLLSDFSFGMGNIARCN